ACRAPPVGGARDALGVGSLLGARTRRREPAHGHAPPPARAGARARTSAGSGASPPASRCGPPKAGTSGTRSVTINPAEAELRPNSCRTGATFLAVPSTANLA
ncbi:MAG TPA: hypothetical protein VHM25_18965, partial [Polyangiaceae bacterium]|nr:hypothetical protein [Polyangiaceae bacterium]